MEQLVVDLLRANDVSTPLPISIDEGFTEVVTFLKAGDRVHALLAAEALLLAQPVFLGGVSVTGLAVTLSVPEAVPVGATMFVDTSFRNPASVPTATDSAGNTYGATYNEPRGTDTRAIRFRAPITSALAPGDEITLSGFGAAPGELGAVVAFAVTADIEETLIVSRTEFTDATTAASGPLTITTVPSLLLGILETNNSLDDPHMPDFDQFALHSNAGDGNRSVLSAKQLVMDAGEYDWAITLNAPRTGSIALMSYPIVAP